MRLFDPVMLNTYSLLQRLKGLSSDILLEEVAEYLWPNLDRGTALSYAEEAIEHWNNADDIRDGYGDWRPLLNQYLSDEERTGLEDAAELNAAEETARSAAFSVLEVAERANRTEE